jgi:predicted O-methyltransferase YrrM
VNASAGGPGAVPERVARALRLAWAHGFDGSCDARVGAVLRTLASYVRGPVLDLGTAYGVSAAWMHAGLGRDGRLLGVEVDPVRHAGAATVFADAANVAVIRADWRDAVREGPFRLVFVDAAPAKEDGVEEVVQGLSVAGIVVVDGLSPGASERGRHADRRLGWLRHPRLSASEVVLGPRRALVLATRIR